MKPATKAPALPLTELTKGTNAKTTQTTAAGTTPLTSAIGTAFSIRVTKELVDSGLSAAACVRFCGAEGLANVQTGSTFRSDFGTTYGIEMSDGKLIGLLGRAVVVLDESGTVVHSQLVPEIAQEPDYDAAIASLG